MNAVVATGTVALGVTQVANLVVYLCDLAHLTPPPAEVAGTIATLILIGLHAAYVKWTGSKEVPAPAPANPPAAQ